MKEVKFLFFLLVSFNIYGQELFFNTPTAFQNLPSSETYQTFQDSKGYLWITSDAGLSRFDGNTLTTFTRKDGISETVVLRPFEDKKGRMWFSTLAGYFFYYENNTFHPIAANEGLKKLCLSFPIHSFFIGENDTLFCATIVCPALIKIPPQENYKNILIVNNPAQECGRWVYVSKADPSHYIFNPGVNGIGDYTDHYFFNNNGKLLVLPYRTRKLTNAYVGCIDRAGNTYVATVEKLYVIRKDQSIEQYQFNAEITCIHSDASGDLWVGTLKGGYLYKHSNLNAKPITFLPDLFISSVMIDREGSIWVATLQRGIFKSNNKNILFFPQKTAYFQKDSHQLNMAYSYNKIVTVFKNDSLSVDSIPVAGRERAYPLISVYVTPGYSYYNSLFTQHYKKGKTITKFPFNFKTEAIFRIAKDTFLLCSPGAISIVTGYKTIVHVKSPFSIRYGTQLEDKTILLCSRGNDGMYAFKNHAFIPYLPEVSQFRTRINYVLEDPAGNLWVATNEHGLYCYDKHKKLHAYNSQKQQLKTDKLNSLALDNQSNLWAASYNGLIKLDYSKGLDDPQIKLFNKSNGIPDLQIDNIMEFNGKLWCSTKEMTFCFETKKMTPNTTPPFIYIEGLSINDQKQDLTKDTLCFNHDQNNIRIQSSTITFKNTGKRDFLYKLIGYDDDWHTSSTGDVQYTNLDHGTYYFVIYGLNNDGRKSDAPATLSFIIERPFWLTWWFISLEIIFLITIFYFYLRYWKNKIEKREKEKTEREKEKIEREKEKSVLNQKIAEFKMTALRAQMNPHFIFNAIGSIQHYILQNEIKQSYDYLAKFSMLIRNILNNSRNEYISLSQEITTLQLYIELEQIRFQYPFKFILEIDEALDVEMDIPTMLIQPYIENSIWHGLMPKKKGGILQLSFKMNADSMLVIIKDNGVGRKPKDPSKKTHVSRGMSITEQRIQTLETTSEKKFVTTIIDLKDEDGNSTGTEVNLIIPFDL